MALHSFLSYCFVMHCPPCSFCYSRQTLHHPSNLALICLALTLHLFLSLTIFYTYSTHPFSPCDQTVSTLSDPLYMPTSFLFQLFYKPNCSQLYLFMSLLPYFQTFHLQSILSFYFCTSYTPCLCPIQCHLFPCNDIFLILTQSCIAKHTVQCSPCPIGGHHSFYVPIHFMSSILCHLQLT